MKKWLKKAYHKFIFDEKGAVSIYAIMITLLLFLFNAVLIDYMRIMVAERETEQAARAAARSVMANFDHGVKTYGLFGVKGGQEEANEIFQTVFEKHLEVDGSSGDIFHFSTPQPVEGSVNVVVDEDRMLAHSEMFKHQVLEEMKYSAPIEVGQALIEGVLGISSAMEEASKLSKVHKKIKDDLDGREQKLDEALAKLEEAREKMANLASKVNANGNSTFPTVNRTGDIVRHYQTYNDNKAELQEELDEDATDQDREDRDKMRQDNEDFLRDANELAEDIYEDVLEIGELLDEVLNLLAQARAHNRNINEELEGADEDVDFSDAISVGESGGSGSADFGGAEEGIGEAREELNKLAVDDSVFEEIISLVESGKRAVDDGHNQDTSAMRSKIFAIGTMINEGLQPHSQQRNWFSNAVDDLASAHSTGTTHLNDAREKLKNLIDELKSTDTKSSDEVEEKEDEAEENLEEANEDLDEFLEGILDSNEGYDDLLVILDKYIEGVNSEVPIERESTDQLADSTFNFIDMIFKSMGNILISARDELYVNEFIMTKFESHDFSEQDYSIEQNEIEFILYGQQNSGENFAAAMAEIFAFRFAVNLVEAFTQTEVRAFGKFMWIAAIAYALKETVNDINEIMLGEPIQFFDRLEFMMTYKDHLRLFLFIHPEGNKIARTMARIHHKTDSDLKQLPTYIQGTASSKVQLWFLPGVTSILSNAGVLSGEVKDREFIIEKEIYYSY